MNVPDPAEARPFPWRLARHWIGLYLLPWALLGLVISVVQAVLAAVLHEREDMVNFLRILETMGEGFRNLIGGAELMPTNVSAIAAIGYQHPTILTMLMINAVMVPTGLLTAQAEQGTLEHLLARPITRSRIYFLAVALTLASQIALVALVFVGTAVWTRVFDYGEPIALGGFVYVTINLMALSCAAAGLATLVAVLSNERSRAVGVIVSYFVASYLINFAAGWLPRLEMLYPYTLYHYCDPNAVLAAGSIPWGDLTLLTAIALGSLGLGWAFWRRRDFYAA